ncbi:acyl-CoA dehydrogenase C-terminal domain-containing protein [Colwellia sp. E2M01]|uniref:acyl-CoA dehydrogenase C-terminal domain-containing protein n=1 Tax=Colwellia sp. E2M01 TaxID=2841561 RepID=UPI001C099B70|nr:acyl-CoA dehydrogenase C-terminal domain-containing protein [Colwellia sp. E2M01]MBU2870229.1 acyl-CoA dehydrogenase C-terminal domain-containing protein [Colwellia sp. E2M01]
MADYKAPLTDMNFLLFQVFSADKMWQQSANFNEQVDQETAIAILQECAKIAEQEIAPIARQGDEIGVNFTLNEEGEGGQVKTAPGYKEAFQTFAQGGWCALGGDIEYGGMGMPKIVSAFVEEMLCSADISFALYPVLTAGAALSLAKHGNEELKERYLTKLYSGEWAASMCLTEAHAGSDLGIIKTKAKPQADGSYQITGSKIFITGGEHDLTDNIIHLVLAKLPDAPDGPKGISLFLVPKITVKDNGELGKNNQVSCGAIEHKMGIHASSTCVMNFDSAQGFLIGELNKGLACMFTMMNFERIGVGIQGMSAGERSYQNALEYAKDRRQGKALNQNGTLSKTSEQISKQPDSIMVHGDVRRMLLSMKALNEGSRALSCYIALQLDYATFATGDLQQKGESLSALMTPLAKAFFTDLGFETTVAGQQVLGGHGYIREWGQEQLVRDARIAQIYEGTNGIQAMDLLLRKVVGSKGAIIKVFIAEVTDFITEQKKLDADSVESINSSGMVEFIEPLQQAITDLTDISELLVTKAGDDLNEIGVAANDYLHLFGYTAMAFVWAKMAAVAITKLQTLDNAADTEQSEFGRDFYNSKLHTAQYYYARLLPRRLSLLATIKSGSTTLFTIDDELF